MRLFIHGARGRMGTRIAALARENSRFQITAEHDVEDHALTQQLPHDSFDVIIDFSSDAGSREAAQIAIEHHAALLVGTTGLSDASVRAIETASQSVAAMIAPNTSLGVAVLNHLAREAARLLGRQYDIDILEWHHTMKRDAPSGTALRLVDALRAEGIELPGERVHSVRAGDIIGEHQVQFAAQGERLILCHAATSRDLFASGALRAAAWLAGQSPGLYTVEQSLGL